ncbi:MAG: ABC transporter permease subunit [Amedibacillus dolichus]|uniref:ABC transporter permease subunit n=1 Tax=Amedibacillus dolichus TaxID=31971 RepID=A0A942ZZ80_9FIRM|nr:ABC transporter permease subunit [Amedibacillus dolichus]MBS4883948.1 ABC transporter permease subunit [Amedibacillus dolichus]
MKTREKEYTFIYTILFIIFLLFLAYPIISLLAKSFQGINGFTLNNYSEVLKNEEFIIALKNSIVVSLSAAACSLGLGFLLAYTLNFTNVWPWLKKTISMIASMPMLLPTITYGFAIIYSFGKQGLLTQLAGFQFFNVYGFGGILMGYIIYTLPTSFLLLNNAMKQIDKKYLLVSRLMQDHALRSFFMTILRPLLATLATCLIQCFFLSFTDFGIPASVGGRYHVIASLLYSYMLGSIPDFVRGAVVAMMMLLPSILSIIIMQYLQRYQIRYQQVSETILKRNRLRDSLLGTLSSGICFALISVFAVIFILPFIRQWPYQISFSMEHIYAVFKDPQLLHVLKNTLLMAFGSAVLGTLFTYAAALISERSHIGKYKCKSLDALSLITNTIPGMVIGIAYLFIFSGTPLQNTMPLLIVCNVIHFFSTPYLMLKESLGKMNASFETTAKLMGDSCLQTIVRIITPNARYSLIEVFSYYFINSAVTVSAIIFIAGAHTMVITTKIKELQYLAKFNEVFVLSFMLFAVNLTVKYICARLARKGKQYE